MELEIMRYKFLLALLGLSLLFTACSAPGGPTTATPEVIPPVIAENTIIAEGRVEPMRYAEIAFNISGDVDEIPVKEGQSVKKGDVLIQLGDESDTKYAAAQLELASVRKDLNDLLNASVEDFAQVVIDLKQAKEDHDKAEQYLNYVRNSPKVPQTETFVYKLQNHEETQVRIRTKHFKGPAPESMITWAENDAALKKAVADKLQLTHDRMAESGVDRDELAVLEARLNAAEAGVAAFAITAPFDGMVADLNAKVGNSIKAREIVVTVADFSGWLIETTDLTEIDVVNLAEDQAVSVKLDAIPDVELQGTILSIGQAFSENQGDVVYEVTILLKDTHPAMRWGMTAEVKFESAE